MTESCDYLVIAHRWYLPDGGVKVGGIDRTKDYLLSAGKTVALLEHPLTTVGVDYEQPRTSCLSLLRGNERRPLAEFTVKPSANPWRWLAETPSAVRVIERALTPGYVTFSADPLCGLAALKLRARGFAKKAVLHFTDYADRRTGNPVLDAAYRWVCMRNLSGSDLVLCVSRRMEEKFRVMRPGGRYLYFPNTPSAGEVSVVDPRSGKRSRRDAVLLGVADGMRHDIMMEAAGKLAGKGLRLRIHVVGGGGGEKSLLAEARKYGVEDCVVVRGFMSRGEALRLTAESGFGIVLYDERVPWNRYRDSLKIREYAACGIPAICDASTSTAEEAAASGAAVLASDAASVASAMETLACDDKVYFAMSDAAAAWAAANDKARYIGRMMEMLGAQDRSR